MSGILEALIEGLAPQQVQQVLPQDKASPEKTEEAMGAAMSTILRGLEKKTQSAEGAEGLWDMLKKQVEQGNLPKESPTSGGVVVRDLDPAVTDEILSGIFGDKAKNVETRIGKVVMLDPESTKKIMGAILPNILGGLFGKAEQAPEESSKALPDILGQARKQLDDKQPRSGGLFESLLDQDHDGDVDLSDLAGIFKAGV